MAVSRDIQPDLSDPKYFEEMFQKMNQTICNMHEDMRKIDMRRINPEELITVSGDKSHEKLPEPVISREDGGKELCMQFDVSGFKPEEIVVRTTETGELQVEARHEEKSDNSRLCQRFSRRFTLPDGTDVDNMTSSLTEDGRLVIRGPVGTNPAIKQGTDM